MRMTLLAFLWLLAAVPAWCADDFGLITDLKGPVTIKLINGKVLNLNREKHLLRVVRSGEEIETGSNGWVKVAALRGNQLYELGGGTRVLVQVGALKALQGKIETRHGFPVPARIGDRSIGAVFLGSTLKGTLSDCLERVRPFNTALVGEVTRISWQDSCGEGAPVTVALADPSGKQVFQAETKAQFVELPGATLLPGVRYSVTLSRSGEDERLSGFLQLVDPGQLAELGRLRLAARSGDQDARIQYLLFLIGNELFAEAKGEASRLAQELPENGYLKGLAKHLNASW